jgi:hypothetical protein
LTPNRRSRVDGTRVLADRNALRGFGADKTGVHKELAKAKNGFARANNGRRRSSGRSAPFCSELARHAEQNHQLLIN